MPDLSMPVFNGDPVTSLFGVIHFPNDFEKAGILASWKLSGALQAASNEEVAGIPSDRIWAVLDMARGYPNIKQECEAAAYRGTQVGAVISYLWRAISNNESASLEDALRACTDIASEAKLSGVRSSFMAAKKEFARVLHFWAIISNDWANRYPGDVKLFVSQAEMLLRYMRGRDIAGDTFHSPKYTIPLPMYDWAVAGRIRIAPLPTVLLPESKKRAGRPPRIPVQE